MDIKFITIIAIAFAVGVSIGLPWILKFRRAFIVPEGYAGLLYQRGKFVEVLRAGGHIRWGRKFTLGLNDLRLMQSLASAQHAGNTLVVSLPGDFVPLKSGEKSPATESKEAT